MKKLLFIAVIFLISCTKENSPIPVERIASPLTPIVNTTTYDFHGYWSCYNWQKTTSTIHRYQLLFTVDSIGTKSSLNDYSSLTTHNQLFTLRPTVVDSNFFNIWSTPLGIKFKGIMINDSTLTVYQYDINVVTGVIDTVQVKNFIRE